MRITGLTLAQFTAAADAVSALLYSGNVIVVADAHDSYTARRPSCWPRLTVRDSRGPGARTAASGRHGPYACWHAYRDVLRETFTRYPQSPPVVIVTRLATYRGLAGFEADYPATGNVNTGSPVSPVTMPELCQCGGHPVTRHIYDGHALTTMRLEENRHSAVTAERSDRQGVPLPPDIAAARLRRYSIQDRCWPETAGVLARSYPDTAGWTDADWDAYLGLARDQQ